MAALPESRQVAVQSGVWFLIAGKVYVVALDLLASVQRSGSGAAGKRGPESAGSGPRAGGIKRTAKLNPYGRR